MGGLGRNEFNAPFMVVVVVVVFPCLFSNFILFYIFLVGGGGGGLFLFLLLLLSRALLSNCTHKTNITSNTVFTPSPAPVESCF